MVRFADRYGCQPVAAVKSFDQSLIDEMQARVDTLLRGVVHVDADFEGLAADHDQRARELDRALNREHRDAWDSIRYAPTR